MGKRLPGQCPSRPAGIALGFFPLGQMAMDSPARPSRLPSYFFLLQEFEFACQMVIPYPAAGFLARQHRAFRLSRLHNDLFAQILRDGQNFILRISIICLR
jgi:hypothetical protein